MKDPRILKAAEILVNYSTKVKKGDCVQIIADYQAREIALAVYKLVVKKGAYSLVHIGLPGATYNYYKYASKTQLKHFPKVAMHEMKNIDVVIYIGAPTNTRELSSVDPKKVTIRQKTTEPVTKERLKKRWVIFEYPTNALAQEADMSLEEFENFVFNSTNINWNKTKKRLNQIKKIIDNASTVRIIGKETDISMSVKGRVAVAADGTFNMPDGEVFTAPVDNSVNGYIYFDFPAIYAGREVDGVRLKFKNGKCIKATAKKGEKFLKEVLKTDKGASYLGELGIGMNYDIKKFVKNILFDEKIGGTVHLALGNAYKECKGKNESAIHWDMIKDMRKGGKLIVDGKIIQKNGKFLV